MVTAVSVNSQNNLPGESQTYDVVIVGGGIVGATLAIALGQSSLRVAVLEAQTPAQAASRQRYYAMSIMTGQFFQELGLWPQIAHAFTPFSQIRLSDGHHGQTVEFQREELDRQNLGYTGHHQGILHTLQREIDRRDNLHYLAPVQVERVDYLPEKAIAWVRDGDQQCAIVAQVIVGADGPQSPLRQGAAIGTQGWKYWQSCLTFTLEHDPQEKLVGFERFHPTGPMGVLPISDRHCQIVWTNPHRRAQELQQLPLTEFTDQLRHNLNGVLGEVTVTSDRLLFPVKLMQSRDYVRHRLALVGDAAHCCHPVGGQGLNLGIRDAMALAEVLLRAHHQGQDLGTLAILEGYQRWRKPENWIILAFTDFLNRFFSNNVFPLVWVRRGGLWAMAWFKPLKMFALKLMTGLLARHPQVSSRSRDQ